MEFERGRIRLFCFPHAGGGMAGFRPWVGNVGPEIEVVPVALPGREARIAELPHRSLETLSEQVADELTPQFQGPFAFFGHSMGAALAWDVARRCEERSLGTLLGVIVSARRAPHLPTRRPPLSELSDQQFVTALGELGGTPHKVLDSPELLELLLPTLRADFSASEHFTAAPELRLRCPIVAMGGAEDQEVDRSEMAEWARATTGAFRSHVFDGGHFYLADGNPEVLRVVREEVLRFDGIAVG